MLTRLVARHRKTYGGSGISLAEVIDTVATARAAGLAVQVNLITGLPGEKPRDILRTCNMLLQLGAMPTVYDIQPFSLLPLSHIEQNPSDYEIEIEYFHGSFGRVPVDVRRSR